MDQNQENRSWSLEEEALRSRKPQSYRLLIICIVVGIFAIGATLVVFVNSIQYADENETANQEQDKKSSPKMLQSGEISNWWGEIPEGFVTNAVHSSGPSNIQPSDYAGAESCQKCHEENYESWSTHPHRWMNAYADESTIKGDFSGVSISYLGGQATFDQENGKNRMTLERDNIRRVYEINQTIGSRFYQYYIGKELEGPEPAGHEFYQVDHVLPFGYWLDEKEWVPVVHTHRVTVDGQLTSEDEQPDEFRSDPFIPPGDALEFVPYHQCNQCHTTFSLGDLFLTAPDVLGLHTPEKIHFSMTDYLGQAHPEIWNSESDPDLVSGENLMKFMMATMEWEAPDHALSLGITCEACHMGSKEHAANPEIKPNFFPVSPHLHVEGSREVELGRTHQNVNWICGRCHVGHRPQLAAGMSTWNSTEYSDAMRGSCYTQLKCIDCHNPHKETGKKWALSPEQDDQKCTTCHQQFENPEALVTHTHHPVNSEGSRCMNCHMPRLNEGLQDVVRTHMIFSPTNAEMIEANQPNACNQCHGEQPIDWTLTYLKDWYGASYSETRIAANYPNREGKTALEWLKNENPSVRLIAADSLARTNSHWALPQLIDALDDPVLLTRQFTAKAMEQMLNIKLKDYDYHFYMTPEERRDPIAKIRTALLSTKVESARNP